MIKWGYRQFYGGYEKMKKKSSVIAKLIIPVAVLGCIAIMIAGVSLYSMTAVQKESNQISGEGVRATICMDEINLAFANTQKLTPCALRRAEQGSV